MTEGTTEPTLETAIKYAQINITDFYRQGGSNYFETFVKKEKVGKRLNIL